MGLFDELSKVLSSIGGGGKTSPELDPDKRPTRKTAARAKKQHTSLASLGIDMSPILNDPKIRKILEEHAKICCGSINSIPEALRQKMAKAVLDAFCGTLPKGQCLLDQLQAIYPMPKAEAMTVARDQTSKLTGRLNQARQEAIGVTEYIWRTTTQLCNHTERDRKKFKWRNPPPGGHPGQAFLCTCYAEGVINSDEIIRAAMKKR